MKRKGTMEVIFKDEVIACYTKDRILKSNLEFDIKIPYISKILCLVEKISCQDFFGEIYLEKENKIYLYINGTKKQTLEILTNLALNLENEIECISFYEKKKGYYCIKIVN